MAVTDYGYGNNRAFLENAPDGTTFRFNVESVYWVKIRGRWVNTDRPTLKLHHEIFTNIDYWKINDVVLPDQQEPKHLEHPATGISDEQLEKLTRLMNLKLKDAWQDGYAAGIVSGFTPSNNPYDLEE